MFLVFMQALDPFFYKHLIFLLQYQVTYSRINFQHDGWLVVAYSFHCQPLVVQQLLILRKFMVGSFVLLAGIS